MKDMQAYINEWDSGKEWMDKVTTDFPELIKLADGMALQNDRKAPVVGDISLMTTVRHIPRASIQQLPTFSVEVNGTKNSIPAIFCDFLVRRMVFNQDTFGKGILSTMQVATENALTLGFQASMANIGNIMNDFGSTLKLIHYNDVVIEKGVLDIADSSYGHVRTRVTKSALKRVLAAAEKNPETTWDVEALKELLSKDPSSDSLSQYVPDSRTGSIDDMDSNTYDIMTRYQYGPYGEVCTYSPVLQKPLRKFNSKSKFGYPRINFLVIDPALLAPFGVSRVRLASPSANFANIYLQSTAKMLLINSDPPLFQKGTFTTPVRLKRGALWQTTDPNAEAKLQELSTTNLNQFENVLQFAANQIYSVMGVTPGSTGAGNTSNNYSKTAAGVQMEQQTRDLSVTQITNVVENYIRQYALTALDLFISEQSGTDFIVVDDKAKEAINLLIPETVGEDNKLKIEWEKLYAGIETWTVDIDLSMGKDEMEDKKRADLQDMLTVMKQTAVPGDPNTMRRSMAIEDQLLEKTAPDIAKATQAPTGMQQPVQEQLPPA